MSTPLDMTKIEEHKPDPEEQALKSKLIDQVMNYIGHCMPAEPTREQTSDAVDNMIVGLLDKMMNEEKHCACGLTMAACAMDDCPSSCDI